MAIRLTILSFMFWSAFVLSRHHPHPYADLSRGEFTDHFSHMNTTRLFPRVGLDLYRQPIRAHLRPLRRAEVWALPKDISARPHNADIGMVDGWPIQKPFVASWTNRPRMHPPGDLVLLAPAALVYTYSPISFTNINKLLIVLFLLYAHVSLYVVFDGALNARNGYKIGAFAALLIYSEVIHWTLEGFYEPAVIAPLILCVRSLIARRNLHAIVFYCAAVFIHFRALFFAPWVTVAAVLLLRTQEWKRWTRREWLLVPLGLFLGGAALGVYAILWPALRDLPLENAVLNLQAPDHASLGAFVLVAACTAGALLYFRAWLDVAVLGWISLMLVSLREAYEWNFVSMLAWLCAPAVNVAPPLTKYVQATRFAFLLFVAVVVLRNAVVPSWLLRL